MEGDMAQDISKQMVYRQLTHADRRAEYRGSSPGGSEALRPLEDRSNCTRLGKAVPSCGGKGPLRYVPETLRFCRVGRLPKLVFKTPAADAAVR